MTLRAIEYPLTILHKPHSDSYVKWGGPEGVARAKRLGATAIDVDAQYAKDGWAATHGPPVFAHEFVAPPDLGGRQIRTLTLAQLATFKSRRKDAVGLTIHPLREVMATAAALDMTLCVEAKSTGDFEQMARDAEETGCRVIVMTLPHQGGKNVGYERLAAAKAAGLPTMVLLNTTRFARGQVPKAQWPHVDYVKGPIRWQRGRPARVIRLGGGSKYGISVTPANAATVTARLRKKWHTKPPVVTPPTPPKPEPRMDDAAKVIAVADKYVAAHYQEGRSGGHWNNDNRFAKDMGWANFQAWCASFVCSCFHEAGLIDLIPTPSPGVDQLAVGFKRNGRWSEYPAVGAIAFYGTAGDLNHTGIVRRYDADFIYVDEGNTNTNGSREGDGCYLKKRLRRSINVVGYGYPKYAEGIKSADPDWGRPAPTPTAPVPPNGGLGRAWRRDGIDLSHHNTGRIDWNKAKSGGIKFAYHKATEGTGFRDGLYASRRAEIHAHDVLFGGYHFARPGASSGFRQARFFLEVAKPRPGEMRPMLDLEDRGGLSDAALDEWVHHFMAEVEQQTGKPGVIYDPHFHLRRSNRTWLWVARYHPQNAAPMVPRPWKNWVIHQFSNGHDGVPHTVPGILMPVDINTLASGFDVAKLKL